MKSSSNSKPPGTTRVERYSVAKVVLLGEARVGKTALGWCLAGNEFQLHPVRHPVQFWTLDELSSFQANGTKREVIIWDMASQPDFRLIHPLSAADADVVLLVFDPTDRPDPLRQVRYWLSQLGTLQEHRCETILVGTRSEVGAPTLTKTDLNAFCREHGIKGGFIATSARNGENLTKLRAKISAQIDWRRLQSVPVSTHFETLKEFVLNARTNRLKRSLLPTLSQLRSRLPAGMRKSLTDDELLNSVRVLESYGYVRLLGGGSSETRVLLAPALFDELAASFVGHARNNQSGLGALDDDLVLSGGYEFKELNGFTDSQKDLLVQSVRVAFVEGRLAVRCQRELIGTRKLLVFPELVTLKRPNEPYALDSLDGVAYTVKGDVENLFAILVVSIGYTNNAQKSEHWHNQARYDFGEGDICGFRHEEEDDGGAGFVLYWGKNTKEATRTFFRGLFERLVQRPKLRVTRHNPVVCRCGHFHDWRTVRKRREEHKDFAHCSECGRKFALPEAQELTLQTQPVESSIEAQTRIVDERTNFEALLAKFEARMKAEKIRSPKCFISYAWGEPDHERWVERMANDLVKAGIQVIYDRYENQFGDSLSRFVSRIANSTNVVVVGTPLYLKKFKNGSATGTVVAAEVDLISQRLMGTSKQKRTVKPLLLAGDKKTALPPLMHDRIHADFLDESAYFATMFDLIVSLYRLPQNHPSVVELRASLRSPDVGDREI